MLNPMHEPSAQNRARALFDLIVIGLVVAVLTIIHYTNYHYNVDYHILLQFAYYVPVIYAAMRFGLEVFYLALLLRYFSYLL